MSTQSVPARPAATWARACPTACTRMSLERGEPLRLQGPAVTGWVLLEHPGPWGPEPAGRSPAVPAAVRAAVEARGLRLNLIRRFGQRPRRGPVTAFLSSSRGREPVLERLLLDDPLSLPPDALDATAAGAASGLGTHVDRPLFLTCTHGRRDACCARLGRPVAAALTAVAAERAWETTHIGGCRFAAGVVSLPSGVYYGRLSPGDVPAMVSATDAGLIAAPWYRGSAGLPPAARNGEAFLRHLTGLRGLHDIHLVGSRAGGDDLHEVEFATPRGRFLLVLHGDRPVSVTMR
jgi:hypothetical protein